MQNAEPTEDLRIRRTRKTLQEALIALTVEKGFDAITVRDITERAMVNRSTFYRHYLDKYDLIERYLDEVYEIISNEDFVNEKMGHSDGPSGLVRFLKHIQDFGDFYRVMLGPRGCSLFIQRLRENSEKRFRYLLAQMPQPANGPSIEMRLSYISCAGIGAIMWWLENNQPCSPEELARWIGELSSNSAGLMPPTPMTLQGR